MLCRIARQWSHPRVASAGGLPPHSSSRCAGAGADGPRPARAAVDSSAARPWRRSHGDRHFTMEQCVGLRTRPLQRQPVPGCPLFAHRCMANDAIGPLLGRHGIKLRGDAGSHREAVQRRLPIVPLHGMAAPTVLRTDAFGEQVVRVRSSPLGGNRTAPVHRGPAGRSGIRSLRQAIGTIGCDQEHCRTSEHIRRADGEDRPGDPSLPAPSPSSLRHGAGSPHRNGSSALRVHYRRSARQNL